MPPSHGIPPFEFDIPDGWHQVTEGLEPGTPFTLTRPGGVGHLMITAAQYVGEKHIQHTEQSLRQLVGRLMGAPPESALVRQHPTLTCVYAVVETPEVHDVAWCLATATDVLLVSFHAPSDGAVTDDLRQIDQFIASIRHV